MRAAVMSLFNISACNIHKYAAKQKKHIKIEKKMKKSLAERKNLLTFADEIKDNSK